MRTEIKKPNVGIVSKRKALIKRFFYEFLTFKPKVIIQANRNKE